ncbi:MAG: Hsp70 family protein [Hyphomicrobiaceae bacterium]
MMNPSPILCGIDFGTSNSTVAVVADGETTLVPLEDGQTSMPSAIFHPAGGEPPVYGRAAVAAYTAREPGRLMRSLKSILGSDLIAERTAVGGRMRSFEEILVGFVGHLKQKAEAHAGRPIRHVVMGRPVHFVDNDPAADRRAERKLGAIARAAGFTDVVFQFEPIAAAMCFEASLTEEETVFVADIGGGTADFSIVKIGRGHGSETGRAGDIRASHGIRVGGTNLDTRLSLATVMPQLGSRSLTEEGLDLPRWPFVELATWHMIHRIATPAKLRMLKEIQRSAAEPELFGRYMGVIERESGHLLAASVERAKIELSRVEEVRIDLDAAVPGVTLEATRTVLDSAISRELERLTGAVEATRSAAGEAGGQVGTLFLTGGTSAVPAVRSLLARAFGNARTVEGDLFDSVGMGLALDAQRRFAGEVGG